MTIERLKQAVISTRVSDRVRRLIQAAAEIRGQTVSLFIAQAAEQRARSELLEPADAEPSETVQER